MRYRSGSPEPAEPSRANPFSWGMWNQQHQQVLAAAKTLGIDYDQANYPRHQADLKAADQKYGDQIRFVGNVMEHLDTLRDANDAMGKGDTRAGNALALQFASQIGHPELNNYNAVTKFVGPELAKTIVPTGASMTERREREDSIAASLAPGQFSGVYNEYQNVLGTQLSGLRGQFKGMFHYMPGNFAQQEFDAHLTSDRQRVLLMMHDAKQQGLIDDQGKPTEAGRKAGLNF